MNLYETLEINESASLDEIKKSYRRLARKYHQYERFWSLLSYFIHKKPLNY